MPWKGIGATIAAFVVSLIALGRASSIVVDWAWFSSVGYVGVFWTAFATKTILFVTIFAVSAFLLWINARLALRLARPLQLRLPATFGPGFAPSRGPASLFAAMAPAHSRRRLDHRTAGCTGRDGQMGPDPAVHLSGSLRSERPAIRQGHRILSVLAAGLRRAQELDDVDAASEQRHGWCGVRAARRNQSGQQALAVFARCRRSRIGTAGGLFRGEGLVLCAGPLPAALQRQRHRCRRRLYRCQYRTAGSLVADLSLRRRRGCHVDQHVAPHISAGHCGGCTDVWQRVPVRRTASWDVPAVLCQAE